MVNKLVQWLRQYKESNKLTYRQLGEQLGYSHAHVAYVLKEQKPLMGEFCIAVAENIPEIDLEQAFIMAGLWTDNNKQGDQAEAQSPRFAERHNGSIPNKSTN